MYKVENIIYTTYIITKEISREFTPKINGMMCINLNRYVIHFGI